MLIADGERTPPTFLGRDRVRKPMLEEDKQEREKEMERWLVVIRALGDESPMGRMIDEQGVGVVQDIFARKKTGTLRTRCVAVLLYIRWAQSKALAPFPLSVETAYAYVDDLRKCKAPATRASSFQKCSGIPERDSGREGGRCNLGQ